MNEKRKEGRVRYFCEICKTFFVSDTLDLSVLKEAAGLYAFAFDHGNHIVTIHFDENFIARTTNVVDIAPGGKNKDNKKRNDDLSWFDKFQD